MVDELCDVCSGPIVVGTGFGVHTIFFGEIHSYSSCRNCYLKNKKPESYYCYERSLYGEPEITEDYSDNEDFIFKGKKKMALFTKGTQDQLTLGKATKIAMAAYGASALTMGIEDLGAIFDGGLPPKQSERFYELLKKQVARSCKIMKVETSALSGIFSSNEPVAEEEVATTESVEVESEAEPVAEVELNQAAE